MPQNNSQLEISSNSIDSVLGDVRDFLVKERGLDVSQTELRAALTDVISSRLDTFAENLASTFTSPTSPELKELERRLTAGATRRESVESAEHPVASNVSVFNGNRTFDKAKLSAMIEYLTRHGSHIYKTGLNKLLFYADFSAFYLRGSGVSGAVYLNRQFGPVSDSTAPILAELIQLGTIQYAEKTRNLEALKGDSSQVLDENERRILDWILANYGELRTREIVDASHAERAYFDTRPNEPISYSYAQFFKLLPPRDFLK